MDPVVHVIVRRLQPFRQSWAEMHINAQFAPGDQCLVAGPTGSGKSLFLMLATGLPVHGIDGECWVAGKQLRSLSPNERASQVALVPSDPHASFSGGYDTVLGELELNLRLIGRDPKREQRSISRVVEALSLENLLSRDPFTLSGGEAMRAAVATALVRTPRLLVMDQAYDHLHPTTRNLLRGVIQRYCKDGMCLIESHCRTPAWASDFTFTIQLRGSATPNTTNAPGDSPRIDASPDSALIATDLRFNYPEGGFAIGPVNLTLQRGAALGLVGANGAGKTTLLRSLALILRPTVKALLCIPPEGARIPVPRRGAENEWAHRVQYCFQEPDDQLYLPTVREEIAEAARLKGDRNVASRVAEWSIALGLEPWLDELPANLPRAYRRLICIAGALGAKPDVILLDEPTAGLDADQVHLLELALRKFRTNGGAVAYVSHDQDFVSRNSTTVSEMAHGKLI